MFNVLHLFLYNIFFSKSVNLVGITSNFRILKGQIQIGSIVVILGSINVCERNIVNYQHIRTTEKGLQAV